MSEPGPADVDATAPRCVLWHPPALPPAASLRQALVRKGIRCVACDGGAMAVAEIVLAAARLTDDDLLILILIDPAHLPRVATVVGVIGEYAPSCRFWLYDESSAAPLREVTRRDIEAWEARDRDAGPPAVTTTPASRTRPPADPMLRLVDEPAAATERAVQPEQQSGRPTDSGAASGGKPPILTDEELAMLLGDDDLDDDDRGR